MNILRIIFRVIGIVIFVLFLIFVILFLLFIALTHDVIEFIKRIFNGKTNDRTESATTKE